MVRRGEESEIEHYALDFREGGREETRFSARDGWKFTNQTIYQDIQPNRHIVFSYTMSMGDKRISSSQATVEFLSKDKGTTRFSPSKRHSLRAPTARRCGKTDGTSCWKRSEKSWQECERRPAHQRRIRC